MVKYSRTKVIAFDIDEALSFEGESGPYLQYAAVRARNILQKLRERDGVDEAALAAALAAEPPRALVDDEHADQLWSLVLDAARLDDVVETAVRTLEFAVLAKYAFGARPELQRAVPRGANPRRGAPGRASLARRRDRVRAPTAHRRLAVMGIDVPGRM